MPQTAKNTVKNWLATQPKKPLLVVLGPTASGKTALAIQLAKQYSGEIISADSRAVYRECELGTAKPTAKELATTVHHCISIYPPAAAVSVVAYRRRAETAIRDVLRRGRLPILTGSHTLLISSIVENYLFPASGADDSSPRPNPRHHCRATKPAKGKRKYNTLLLGLNPPRAELYTRIDQRAEAMLAAGLLAEVRELAKKYDRYCPALRGHGYRELLDYLNGEKTLAQASDEMKQDTRHYAKRQITWWRNSPLAKEIQWL